MSTDISALAPADDLQAQRDYVRSLEEKGFGYDLAVGDAFVRGMREIGYKSTSTAIAELLDNSLQAGATRINVVFDFETGRKPTSIAIVDNGHGMEPAMLRLSLIWGGTHREKDGRKGFGRFGYGLPSASISQARRVEVYSKTNDGTWYRAYLDVDEIAEGKWTKGNRIQMPEAERVDPPRFVRDHMEKHPTHSPGGPQHGTIVVWTKLDRIDFRQREKLRNGLVTDLGVIYRNFLREASLTVDEVTVEPCDPLFLTPGFRYYDLEGDTDRAIAIGDQPTVIEVQDKESGDVLGQLRVRYSRFPATFLRKPEAKHTNKPGRKAMNERLEVADANNGIIFCRLGRQIDVVRPPRWLMSINATTDRYWAVEVDFDATLDDEFAITTSKQQVVPSERIWNILTDKGGLKSAIGQMRADYDKDAAEVIEKAEADPETKRASEEVMERLGPFKPRKPTDQTPERKKEAEDNLEREVQRRSELAGINPNDVKKELAARQLGRPYRVAVEDLPGAPFYRGEPQGAQKVLFLNSAHRFFTDVYAGPGSSPWLRASLETLLWVLAESEIDAVDSRRTFYETERVHWSQLLNAALTELRSISAVVDSMPEQDEAGEPAA